MPDVTLAGHAVSVKGMSLYYLRCSLSSWASSGEVVATWF